MNDTLIPLATAIGVASPIVCALALAVVAMWKRGDTVVQREREDCDKRIEKIERRVEKLEQEGAELRAENERWRGKWEAEVKRNVELANMPSRDKPFRPPMPSDEDTKTRELRSLITDEALRHYVDSTPPRPRPLPPRKR